MSKTARSSSDTVGRVGSAPVAIMLTLLWPSEAGATDIGFMGAHLDYAVGGATGKDGGVRHNLDVAAVGGSFDPRGVSKGVWLAGGSLVTGFGAYPTFLCLPEVGPGWFFPFAWTNVGAVAGPALRLDPFGFGGGLRVALAVLAFEVGGRVLLVTTPEDDPELQATGMIGFGRF